MRSKIVLGLLGAGSFALLASSCGDVGEAEKGSEVVEHAEEALIHGVPTFTQVATSGNTVWLPLAVGQNCTVTVQTSGATSSRDPLLAIIVNNGVGAPAGSSDTPCVRGTPTATDGYSTKAFNDNFSGFNARVSWKNSGFSTVTAFTTGFLKGSFPSYGPLNVTYSVTGCFNPANNVPTNTFSQDFQANGIQASLSGSIWTNTPRPGAPSDCQDPVLYEIDPGLGNGARCNDDCPPDPGVDPNNQSCMVNNPGTNFWYFSKAWFASGPYTVNK